jgi:hypothetical protein
MKSIEPKLFATCRYSNAKKNCHLVTIHHLHESMFFSSSELRLYCGLSFCNMHACGKEADHMKNLVAIKFRIQSHGWQWLMTSNCIDSVIAWISTYQVEEPLHSMLMVPDTFTWIEVRHCCVACKKQLAIWNSDIAKARLFLYLV